MTRRLYLRPLGLLPADSTACATAPLAGGRFLFSMVELILRSRDELTRESLPLAELLSWSRLQPRAIADRVGTLLNSLTLPRPALAGLELSSPRLMAIVNVTPDSFSDGGDYFDPDRAIQHGLALWQNGAEIIDVGGESTRPGAAAVGEAEELRRIIPVVSALAARGARVSIDSRHAPVMRAALAAGAQIINDVTGLTGDPDSLNLAAASEAAIILMHMQGDPGTMQQAPSYDNVALDVFDWLEARVNACLAAGIARSRLIVDPGIGFGKSVAHNLEIMRSLSLYHGLGTALLLGVSRKRFIAALSQNEPPKNRLPGTLAACLEGLNQGCQLIRIHDLAAALQARAVWNGLHP